MSAVNLSKSRDASYSYSNYVLWGLAEVTTALLVFCAPAFPAIFRESSPPRRLYNSLQAKIKTIHSHGNLSLNKKLSKSPPAADPQAVSGSWRTRFDNGSRVSLVELEPVRIESTQKFDEESVESNPGGILISS